MKPHTKALVVAEALGLQRAKEKGIEHSSDRFKTPALAAQCLNELFDEAR